MESARSPLKSLLHSLFTTMCCIRPRVERLRVSPTYTSLRGWVITAHRDRNLAFSLKELRAWNFLQSRGAAFPQYGKGVDNVNDTAGASVGNSGRAQPRNIDVSTMTMTTIVPGESKQHRRIERSCFLSVYLRPVRFVEIYPIRDRCVAVTVTLSIDYQRVPTASNGPRRYSYPTNSPISCTVS